jgi:hypothetical protein
VESVPEVDFAPDQAPEAAQAVAFADDQASEALAPLVIELGLAARRTVGAAAFTETVADCAAVPPGPVQVNVKVVLELSAPVDCEPLEGRAPLQPPDAWQAVAFAEDQLSVALPPLATALGPTLRLTVGVGDLTDTIVDWLPRPEGPSQASPYMASFSMGPRVAEPEVGFGPDHAP